MDQRRDNLAQWAIAQLTDTLTTPMQSTFHMVSGDASFRRYFRLSYGSHSWIAVDAPPDKEDNPRFVKIAETWHTAGIAVPKVLALDEVQGFMLLQDFGDLQFGVSIQQAASAEQWVDVEQLYKQALDQLVKIQALPAKQLPIYDQALLEQEMHLFRDWLCHQYLGLELSASEKTMLEACFDVLTKNALEQPQVVVHRDYHSRNLMLVPDADSASDSYGIGVIDFQDAVIGAVTYDVVSLVRDCYVRWPATLTKSLTEYAWQSSYERGLHQLAQADYQRAFDWMGMQRHLKAAGIFARLHLRDGKSGYLADIPNTLQYLSDVSQGYPKFSDLHHWLEARVMSELKTKPELKTQSELKTVAAE